MSKIANPTKVITGVNTRFSYANIWDPKSINGGKPKYSVSLIIPKDDTVTVNKIKALKSEGYRSAEGSGLSKEFQDKIMQHDEQIAAVKTQIAMVRGEIYEVKDMLMTIMERLGMGRSDFNQDD